MLYTHAHIYICPENILGYTTPVKHKIQQVSRKLMNKVFVNHLRKTSVVVVKGV